MGQIKATFPLTEDRQSAVIRSLSLQRGSLAAHRVLYGPLPPSLAPVAEPAFSLSVLLARPHLCVRAAATGRASQGGAAIDYLATSRRNWEVNFGARAAVRQFERGASLSRLLSRPAFVYIYITSSTPPPLVHIIWLFPFAGGRLSAGRLLRTDCVMGLSCMF